MQQLMSMTNSRTMTSREIAELTGREHDSVLRSVRNIYDSLPADLRTGIISTAYVDANGKSQPMFSLDKEAVLCLISGYDITARMRIIRRWQELEALNNKPLSRLERLEAEVQAEKERLIMLETVKHQKAVIATKQVLTDDGTEYASIQRMRITNPNLRPSGKLLSRISLAQEYEVGEVYSHYAVTAAAKVKTYHKDVWELCYPDADFPE